jgi:hypothetical protein
VHDSAKGQTGENFRRRVGERDGPERSKGAGVGKSWTRLKRDHQIDGGFIGWRPSPSKKTRARNDGENGEH